MVQKEKLFEQFPPVTTQEWMDKLSVDLKGEDYDKKLVWKTKEGFDVKPFYRAEDVDKLAHINCLPGEFPFARGIKIKDNNWHIRQNIDVTDYHSANQKALGILMKGVDSLGFIIADPETVSEKNFRILLEGIHIESIEINFWCNGKAGEILEILSKIASSDGLCDQIHGAIETDPVGRLMLNGKLCIPVEAGLNYLASVTHSSAVLPKIRTIQINASVFNNSGADVVQELAFAISMGSEYLSQLTAKGMEPEFAASRIGFTFGTGSNYFFEIAKIRAARLLWSVVNRGFNPEKSDVRMYVHSVTSRWNKTIYDPYVNMLRTQTEAMSAILGGADTVTVEPFDMVFRQPDEFSERIARNQQLILREESYFDKVADPAAGSYYIENLTTLIADNAWKLFLEADEKGGFLACLKSGFIQAKIEESAEKRKKSIATRKTVFLGTNIYPEKKERVFSNVDFNRAFQKTSSEKEMNVTPLNIFRGSEEYEKLRLKVDRAAQRPSVFLFPIGDPVMRRARSKFSSEFFSCGGYRIIENSGFKSVEEGIKVASDSRADIVVICSSDEEYLIYAPDIYKALKDNAILVIAGNPVSINELKAAGLDLFIHLGSDIPEMLETINALTGVASQKKDYETKVQI